ncbi:MAG: hypothetical protein R6W92_08505 [Desulfocurvibacter africanus]
MMRFLVLSLITGLLCGCSSRQMHHGSLNSWVGAPIDSYIRANGQPSGRRDLPNGYAVYSFSNTGSGYKPIESQSNHEARSYGTTRGVEGSLYKDPRLNLSCTVWLETDKEGHIVRWRQQGNNCY